MPAKNTPRSTAESASDEPIGFYTDPHAYHVLHLDGTRDDVAFFEKLVWENLRTPHPLARERKPRLRWIEPACGTGRYTLELARRGHAAAGFDLSADMIAYAKQANSNLEKIPGRGDPVPPCYFVGSFDEFAVPSDGPREFDVCFCPINSIRHVLSDEAMLGHLDCVRKCLGPGGVYLLGIELLDDQTPRVVSEDIWEGSLAGMHVKQIATYFPPEHHAKGPHARRERVMSQLIVTRTIGKGKAATRAEEMRSFEYDLRTYTHQQFTSLLRKAGWHIRAAYAGSHQIASTQVAGYYQLILSPEAETRVD